MENPPIRFKQNHQSKSQQTSGQRCSTSSFLDPGIPGFLFERVGILGNMIVRKEVYTGIQLFYNRFVRSQFDPDYVSALGLSCDLGGTFEVIAEPDICLTEQNQKQ